MPLPLMARPPRPLACIASPIRIISNTRLTPIIQEVFRPTPIHLAQALHVSLDNMVFEEGERGPPDELRLQFEAISQFTPEEKEVARTVLESLILRHAVNRFSRSAPQASG